ncbi:hypothetical protein GCM10022224_088980 [Nonomuraea antimicrobica]|uniref:HEAT repeat-containing protein n=1 Tax=Nonomuraea antimicrobica TaxID=561173 RepID=A0ABP7DYA5_9ACTN
MNPGTRKLSDDDRLTFLAHAISMSSLYGPGPWPPHAQELPDEPPRPDDGRPYISSAVMDGIRTHHFAIDPDPGAVAEVADLLRNDAPYERLHDRLAAASALAICDELLRELSRRPPLGQRLYDAGRWLAEHGTRREATKIGIVLVGACGGEPDRELLLLLGTLEEFTLYAVVALLRTQPDPERAVFELAGRVKDWGRVHAVERLAGSHDPEVKAWLLREGFRNGITNEYLAPIAATTGDLYSALLDPEPDDALVDGAGDLLAALVVGEGGPTSGISAYADAVPALARYADLAATREATLGRLLSLLSVTEGLREAPADGFGWRGGDLEVLRRRYEEVLGQPRWSGLALAGVADPAGADFGAALYCASRLGLPILPQAEARVRLEPGDDSAWAAVIRLAAPEALVALAGELLPVESLANGPGERLFGDGHEQVLESVVEELGAYPGLGLPLIRVALRNRLIRVRANAVRSLAAWPTVPEEALTWVRAAHEAEPDDGVRADMRTLLTRDVLTRDVLTCDGDRPPHRRDDERRRGGHAAS